MSKRFNRYGLFYWAALILSILISLCLFTTAYSGLLNPQEYPMLAVFGMSFPIFLIVQACVIIFWLLFKKFKFAFLFFVPILLCINPILTYCPLNFWDNSLTPEQKKSEFSLLTYNVYAFSDFKERKDINHNPTISHILKSDADVVCLQECYTFEPLPYEKYTKEQYDSLISRYPYRLVLSNDIGVLSKYPISDSEIINSDNETFSGARFKLQLKGNTITVYNVHLQSVGLTKSDKELYSSVTSVKSATEKIDSAKQTIKDLRNQLYHKLAMSMQERATQAQHIAKDLNNQQGNVILCGDFNDIPDSYVYRTIKGNMTDAYCKCGFGPGITYHANKFYFRIDQIFYRGNIEAVSIQRPKWDSSDHYPQIVKFVKK